MRKGFGIVCKRGNRKKAQDKYGGHFTGWNNGLLFELPEISCNCATITLLRNFYRPEYWNTPEIHRKLTMVYNLQYVWKQLLA